FLHRSASHPPLHSSPTRRSSDLDGGFCAIDGTIAKRGDTYYLVMKDETFFPPARNIRVATSKHATGPYGPASPAFTARDTEGPSDRKNTRLNSSHRTISYAVFCL